MPTGTRSSMSAKSTTKPMIATASALIADGSLDRPDLVAAAHQLRPEDEAPGADGDEQHGGDVARPGDREERPGRQVEVVGEDVVGARRHDLVEEHDRLNRDDEEEDERREDV